METEKKKEKMKTSDKIITTLLLLAIFIGVGYFAAKHFGLIGGQTAVIEEPEGIETVEIWNAKNYGPMDWVEEMESLSPYMEESPAVYFTGEYIPEGEGAGLQNVLQVDRETFESKVTKATVNQMAKGITEDIDDCLNKNFTCSLSREIEELEYEYQVWNIDLNYLIENEVELKCDNIKVQKLCASDADSMFPGSLVRIYAICSMEVITVASNGDMSNTVFGDVGETVTLKAYLVGGGNQIRGYDGYLNDVKLAR